MTEEQKKATKQRCTKISPDGFQCERKLGHSGWCYYSGQTDPDPHIIDIHRFQAGWVNQGKTSKRRVFLTQLFCLTVMWSFGFLLPFSFTMREIWFVLMVLTSLMVLPGYLRNYHEWRKAV